jgi:hypothetical protein
MLARMLISNIGLLYTIMHVESFIVHAGADRLIGCRTNKLIRSASDSAATSTMCDIPVNRNIDARICDLLIWDHTVLALSATKLETPETSR